MIGNHENISNCNLKVGSHEDESWQSQILSFTLKKKQKNASFEYALIDVSKVRELNDVQGSIEHRYSG